MSKGRPLVRPVAGQDSTPDAEVDMMMKRKSPSPVRRKHAKAGTLNLRPSGPPVGPADVTLDAPSDPEQTAPYAPGRCRVHLVEGSGTHPSSEVQQLLRSRLRSAALLMFGGFAVFLVWHIFMFESATTLDIATLAAHI